MKIKTEEWEINATTPAKIRQPKLLVSREGEGKKIFVFDISWQIIQHILREVFSTSLLFLLSVF